MAGVRRTGREGRTLQTFVWSVAAALPLPGLDVCFGGVAQGGKNPCPLRLPCRLIEHVLAGNRWSPATHQAFPPTFRAAARTAVLINGTRGFGSAPRRPRRSPRRAPPPSPEARSISLPAEVLQHILALAAAPLSVWLRMMPEAEF